MEYVLRIMLIEDDSKTCEQIAEYCKAFIDIELTKVTDSSFEGLTYLSNHAIDVVILDLELQNGEGSGIHFLSELANTQLINKPYILVTTNNSSHTTYEIIRNLGADFIFYKHSRDYSSCTSIDFLRMTKEQIQNFHNSNNNSQTVSSTTLKEVYYRKIKTELNAIGISTKLNGYKYNSSYSHSYSKGLENILYRRFRDSLHSVATMKSRIYFAAKT